MLSVGTEPSNVPIRLAADEVDPEWQFQFGWSHVTSIGIRTNKSLGAHYYKLSADQGNAHAQLNDGILLFEGDGIPMNKSHAAHYYTLAADQSFSQAQHISAKSMLAGNDIQKDKEKGIEYLRCAADQGLTSAQLDFASLLWQGSVIERDDIRSAHYLKLAADQGSIEGQIEYADWLFRGDGMSDIVQCRESERHLRMSVAQSVSKAQMRLGIALLSGLFGRFDFLEARRLFEQASKSEKSSGRFASVLLDSLLMPDCELKSALTFSANGNIFAFLRSSVNASIPLIKIMNPHLNDQTQSTDQIFESWRDIAASRWSISLIYHRLNTLPLLWNILPSLVRCRPIYWGAHRFQK
jgi:TPR repeat protein